MTNRRAFKTKDSKLVHETLELTIQFQAAIEAKCLELEISPLELPSSSIPTNVLYEIVCSYNAMYNKLLTEELLHSGNIYNTGKLTH